MWYLKLKIMMVSFKVNTLTADINILNVRDKQEAL